MKKYRQSTITYIEKGNIETLVGIVLQEITTDNSGRCQLILRSDRTFLSLESPTDGYGRTYGEVLTGVERTMNEGLAKDFVVGGFERRDGSWTPRHQYRPGDPNILNGIRAKQPKEDYESDEPTYLYPYFSFSNWGELTSPNEEIAMALDEELSLLLDTLSEEQ